MDYGRGKTNIDLENGMRYGVIAQNTVSGEALEQLTFDYALNCPECGSDALVKSKSIHDDYYCRSCHTWHMSDACYGETSIGFHFDDAEYKLIDCLDSDLMVVKSPYFTMARFCSPCVPGAGDLNSPNGNVQTYCLGADWFDSDNPCPYPIYSVVTGDLVSAAA